MDHCFDPPGRDLYYGDGVGAVVDEGVVEVNEAQRGIEFLVSAAEEAGNDHGGIDLGADLDRIGDEVAEVRGPCPQLPLETDQIRLLSASPEIDRPRNVNVPADHPFLLLEPVTYALCAGVEGSTASSAWPGIVQKRRVQCSALMLPSGGSRPA